MRRLAIALLLATAACGGDAPEPSAPPDPAVRPGPPVTGLLDERDSIVAGSREDRWALELAAGQRVAIVVRSDSFDASLRLRAPSGLMIAANQDALGRDAAITFLAPAAGRYTVVVRAEDGDSARGGYELAIEELTGLVAKPGVIGTIAIGDSVAGLLEAGDHLTIGMAGERTDRRRGLVDYYVFRAESAGVVAVTLSSGEFDAFLAVGDSGRYTSAQDDDGGGGTNARVLWPVEAGKSYEIAAASLLADRRPGRYTLAVRRHSAVRATPGDTTNNVVVPLALPRPGQLVCGGKALPYAAPYDRSRTTHPTLVFDGASRVGTSGTWDPPDESAPELVLCMQRSRVVLQVCHYMGPSITRYRNAWVGQLREARTARVLDEARVQGDAPRQCNSREPYSLTVLDGSLGYAGDALAELRPRVLPWIAHDSGAAAPASPRPRGAGSATAAGRPKPDAQPGALKK